MTNSKRIVCLFFFLSLLPLLLLLNESARSTIIFKFSEFFAWKSHRISKMEKPKIFSTNHFMEKAGKLIFHIDLTCLKTNEQHIKFHAKICEKITNFKGFSHLLLLLLFIFFFCFCIKNWNFQWENRSQNWENGSFIHFFFVYVTF